MKDSEKGVFVSLDAKNGIIRRYITVDGPILMTHEAVADGPVTFTPTVVEEFRTNPMEVFRINYPKPPPTPPVGGTPVQMKMAA
jgi:hypothetical protein